MKYILTVLIILLVAGCYSPRFEKEFTEHFIPEIVDEDLTACGTEEDREVYRLSEVFFDNDEVLPFRVNLVYYSNGFGTIPRSFFEKRIADASEFFMEASAGISLELDSYIVKETRPFEDSLSMSYIVHAEGNRGEIAKLRNYYIIDAYKFWDRVYGKNNVLNIHVMFDRNANVAGIAGGIGSTFCAVSLDYIETEYRTLEHEIAHMLGLYHPHTTDDSEFGCNPYTGDKVGDTYKSPTLRGIISDSCTLHENWRELVVMEWYESRNSPTILEDMPAPMLDTLIHNVMSYTKGGCRIGFTQGQILRMRKTIETSKDLRNAVYGLGQSLDDMIWLETFEDKQ